MDFAEKGRMKMSRKTDTVEQALEDIRQGKIVMVKRRGFYLCGRVCHA